MSDKTLQFYKSKNKKLSEQYNSVTFESVHKDWLEYLPKKDGLILDVGAGSGRDALWFANQGYQVKAVEPVVEFYEQFKHNHQKSDIEWIIDTLPELNKLEKHNNQFSLILLSAVWMHLTTNERENSLKVLSKLNSENGLLVISLRHGDSPDEREMYPVSSNEILELGEKYKYSLKALKTSEDKLNRSDVYWETIVLEKMS